MQKNVVIAENVLVQNLGTGRSYINLFIRTEQIESVDNEITEQLVAGQQHVLNNPVTRDRIIDIVVRANYPDGASEAAIRKGVINSQDVDFVAFNNFVESVKNDIDEKL